MPGTLAWLDARVEAALLALAVVAVTLLAIFGYRKWKASRVPAQEKERLRRALLSSRGKLSDAVLVEVRENLLFFTYAVRGMEYTASQDITLLRNLVPRDLSSLDSIAVKYLPENPANSIVVAEDWSGLR